MKKRFALEYEFSFTAQAWLWWPWFVMFSQISSNWYTFKLKLTKDYGKITNFLLLQKSQQFETYLQKSDQASIVILINESRFSPSIRSLSHNRSTCWRLLGSGHRLWDVFSCSYLQQLLQNLPYTGGLDPCPRTHPGRSYSQPNLWDIRATRSIYWPIHLHWPVWLYRCY